MNFNDQNQVFLQADQMIPYQKFYETKFKLFSEIPKLMNGKYVIILSGNFIKDYQIEIFVNFKDDDMISLRGFSKGQEIVCVEFSQKEFEFSKNVLSALCKKGNSAKTKLKNRDGTPNDSIIEVCIYLFFYSLTCICFMENPKMKTKVIRVKGKKKTIKVYTFTEEDVNKEIFPTFFISLDVLEEKKVPSIVLETSSIEKMVNKFDYKDKKLIIPFDEFNIYLRDVDEKMYCRRVGDEMQTVIYIRGKRAISLNICDKEFKTIIDENIDIFYDRKKLSTDDIASNYVDIILFTLYIFSYYKIKKVMSKRLESKSSTDNSKENTTESDDSTQDRCGKTKYIPFVQYVISDDMPLQMRKSPRKPTYNRLEWVRTGHERRYKSGKVIYVDECICKRDNSLLSSNTNNDKYILR